jgi:Tol biopolymer transport system component
LAYQANADLARVAWFDRSGSELGRALPAGKYQNVRLSPDGQQVAFERAAAGIGTFDLWTLDIQRGVEARLTSDIGNEIRGLWTPDRSAFVYSAGSNGPPSMVIRDMATGAERRLHPGVGLQTAEDVTPDGRSILYSERANTAGIFRFYLVPLAGGDATPLFEANVNYGHARFSPDGKWLAYASDETGELEISVARWPLSRERLRISTGGGFHPRWSPDGRELFYLSDAGLMSVPMTAGQPGKARVLFDAARAGVWSDFDVTRDGRFLAIVSQSVGARQPLTVIVNWLATLQGR